MFWNKHFWMQRLHVYGTYSLPHNLDFTCNGEILVFGVDIFQPYTAFLDQIDCVFLFHTIYRRENNSNQNWSWMCYWFENGICFFAIFIVTMFEKCLKNNWWIFTLNALMKHNFSVVTTYQSSQPSYVEPISLEPISLELCILSYHYFILLILNWGYGVFVKTILKTIEGCCLLADGDITAGSPPRNWAHLYTMQVFIYYFWKEAYKVDDFYMFTQ